MKIDVIRLDMEKTKAHWPRDVPFAPAYIHSRKPGDKARWLVLDLPLDPNKPSPRPLMWAQAEHDEYVRIPLFSYALSPKSDLALAYMLQLGLSCAGHLPNAVSNFYVVTGSPVELLYDPETDVNTGLLYWVGFAITLES
jgi:hypothetical protein